MHITEKIIAARSGTTLPIRCCSNRRRRVRRTKSAAQRTKTVIEAIWKMIPATIIFVPGSVLPFSWFAAMEAIAPPTAWTTRETMSQVTKMKRYTLGLRIEESRPRIWMKRPRRT